MDAQERIKAVIEHYRLNVKSFSEKCGYPRPQAFYDILKGKTKEVSQAMCKKILAAFPDVNRTWLLTGDGEMLQPAENTASRPMMQMHTVPLVSISAMAGPIDSYYEEGEELMRCERIPDPTMRAELAVPINGDSMEPLFPNGAIAFITRINEQAFIPWGHPLVIETENGVYIKNVMPDEDNTSYIWGNSINPKYPPMHIPKQSIFRMYRVLNVSRQFYTM